MARLFNSLTIKRFGVLFTLTLCLSGTLAAQKTVLGKVVDALSGEPLPFVNLFFKNTETGAVTGLDGQFQLPVSDSVSQLVVAFFGYLTDTLPIKTDRFMLIGLTESPLNFGTLNCIPIRQDPTPCRGNSPVVLPKWENTPGIQYPAQLLQGKVAGLIVTRAGDNPNEDFLLRLRGISTFSQRSSPLVVVNGLPESSLYMLDPNDIASFRVLKDAASAAKWGILGASGVVGINW